MEPDARCQWWVPRSAVARRGGPAAQALIMATITPCRALLELRDRDGNTNQRRPKLDVVVVVVRRCERPAPARPCFRPWLNPLNVAARSAAERTGCGNRTDHAPTRNPESLLHRPRVSRKLTAVLA